MPVRGSGKDGCKPNSTEHTLNTWLNKSQARQYFKEARFPYKTGELGPPGPGIAGVRDAHHVVGGHVPRSEGPAHDFPAPGKASVVHLQWSTDTREAANTWMHRSWSCCCQTYTAAHETSMTTSALQTTSIDQEGNAVVNTVPLEDIERCTVVADQPFVGEVVCKRGAVACANSAWGRYVVSQPCFLAASTAALLSCIFHIAANAVVPKSVDLFYAAAWCLYIAVFLHICLVLHAFMADATCALLCHFCACCSRGKVKDPATGTCCVEYGEPREECDPFPHDPSGTQIPAEVLERSEVPGSTSTTRLRQGGGVLCCGCSRRSWGMLATLLVFGLAAATSACAVAVWWTTFPGSGGTPSSGTCAVSTAERAWQNFTCQPEYSSSDTKCWNKVAGGGGGGNDPQPAPPVLRVLQAVGWMPPSPSAGYQPFEALSSPDQPADRRRLQSSPSPTPTPNADLAFACPAGSSAIDSVNVYSQSKATSSSGTPVGDATCGMCKSAFLPSYRACAVLTALYFLSFIVAYVLGLAPRIPQEPWRYLDEGTAYIFVMTRYGTLGACAVVGDQRNAQQIVRAVMAARARIAAELVASGGAPPALVDVYGTNGRAGCWACNTVGTGAPTLLLLQLKWLLRYLDPANVLYFIPAL